MRFLVILALMVAPLSAQAFSYATGGCASSGCAQGEQWEYTNGNEIDTALDALETTTASHTSTLSGLATTYLALAGGTITGGVTFASGASIDMTNAVMAVNSGAGVEPSGTGYILATAMSATGQIDDNDLAAGAVDGGTGGEIADGSITSADIADGTVTGTDILNDTIVLTTDTGGDYVATITNSDGYIAVGGAGTEGRAVTLTLASTVALDSDLDGKSVASSTDNAIVRFDGTSGDVQDSLVTIADSTGSITTPGTISAGGSTGASTFTLRNTVDSGWVECGVVGTTMTCAVDADGTPDGTL